MYKTKSNPKKQPLDFPPQSYSQQSFVFPHFKMKNEEGDNFHPSLSHLTVHPPANYFGFILKHISRFLPLLSLATILNLVQVTLIFLTKLTSLLVSLFPPMTIYMILNILQSLKKYLGSIPIMKCSMLVNCRALM